MSTIYILPDNGKYKLMHKQQGQKLPRQVEVVNTLQTQYVPAIFADKERAERTLEGIKAGWKWRAV